mmetsp:Transcript_1019/g.2468  ORF Transcript_1019/g.2468 Transcript_1019/m.2468 type:complete len:127 (+) Transcript_1019:955-1335(+)
MTSHDMTKLEAHARDCFKADTTSLFRFDSIRFEACPHQNQLKPLPRGVRPATARARSEQYSAPVMAQLSLLPGTVSFGKSSRREGLFWLRLRRSQRIPVLIRNSLTFKLSFFSSYLSSLRWYGYIS